MNLSRRHVASVSVLREGPLFQNVTALLSCRSIGGPNGNISYFKNWMTKTPHKSAAEMIHVFQNADWPMQQFQ